MIIFTAAPKVVRYIARPSLRYHEYDQQKRWSIKVTWNAAQPLHQLSNANTVSQESFKSIIKESMT